MPDGRVGAPRKSLRKGPDPEGPQWPFMVVSLPWRFSLRPRGQRTKNTLGWRWQAV